MKRIINHPVGSIVADVVAALGGDATAESVLKAIATYGQHADTEDSEPSRATILGYAEDPDTQCNYSFACLILDFLHDQKIEDTAALERAQNVCLSVLQSARTRQVRFERPPGSDPGTVLGLQDGIGVYIAVRRDTGDGSLRQELLLLDRQGKADSKSYATYITPEVVYRGTWGMSHNALYCSTHGARADFRRDVAFFTIARDLSARRSQPSIMCGILSGLSTKEFLPVAIPILFIKLGRSSLPDAFGKIGDLNDAVLRREFRGLERSINEVAAPLRKGIDEAFNTFSLASGNNILIPARNIGQSLAALPDHHALVDARIVSFLAKMSAEAVAHKEPDSGTAPEPRA